MAIRRRLLVLLVALGAPALVLARPGRPDEVWLHAAEELGFEGDLACLALGSVPDERLGDAISVLLVAANDPSRVDARRAARKSLDALGPRAAAILVAEGQSEVKRGVVGAVRQAAAAGTGFFFSLFGALLRTLDAGERQRVIAVIEALGPREAEIVGRLRNHPQPNVRAMFGERP